MKALHCIVACWWFSTCTILRWCRHLMQRECTIYHCLVHLRSALWCVFSAYTNITQKERQVCSPFVKALHWVIFCWTYSVCDCVATWCTTSVLCIVLCSAVCYSAWTVHRGWQSVCTANVLWITHILLLMFCVAIYSMVIFWYAQQCECVMHDVCLLSSEKW